MARAPNKTTAARVEMEARITRWSNQLNKLSDEIADWSLTRRKPSRYRPAAIALPTGDGPLVGSVSTN
jgi:hypothetical protein